MPYVFTTQQQAKLTQLYAEAKSKSEGANPIGAYAEAYQYVADVLAGKVDLAAGTSAPITLGSDVQQVQLWFAGAARANAGKGPFATLIREYTQVQAELRGMGRFSDAKMQEASNAVGMAALGDMLKPDNQGKLLTITQIADNDATAVGKVLFPNIPNAQKNPAWSGVVLFVMLGSDQTWRVYGPNGQYTDSTQCMDTGYATKALKFAMDRTASKEGQVPWFSSKDQEILIGMWKLQNKIPPTQPIGALDYPSVLINAVTSSVSNTSDVLIRLLTNYVRCQGIDFSKVKPVASLLGNDVTSLPAGTDTSRDSASFISDSNPNDHRVVIKAGGRVWDAYVTQKNAATGFKNWEDFKKAVAISNPEITDLSKVAAGTTLMLPEKMTDGSIIYHYANGGRINSNESTGDYSMVAPSANNAGGVLLHSRKKVDAQADGTPIYEVKHVTSNGVKESSYVGRQVGKEGTAQIQSLTERSDTNADGRVDQVLTRNWFTHDVYQTNTYSLDQSTSSSSHLNFGSANYSLANFSQRAAAEYRLNQMNQRGELWHNSWSTFTSNTTYWLLVGGAGSGPGLQPGGGTGLKLPSNWLNPGSGDVGLKPPSNWGNPIGAFYDSQTAVYDNAASIAHKTTRAMNVNGQTISMSQLAELDSNGDGQLSTEEAAGVRLWADTNENGRLDNGELLNVDTPIKNADYSFYTRGNGKGGRTGTLTMLVAPAVNSLAYPTVVNTLIVAPLINIPSMPVYMGVPVSNYQHLRRTQEFFPTFSGYLLWKPNQVMLTWNNNQYDNLVGTEADDNFDVNYYASVQDDLNVKQNLHLVRNFMAGAGNDLMGGSVRSDNLWGGTGNDTVYGYAGDDKVYGEEGNDVLFGQDGHDLLDGGTGNDILSGGNGDDIAWGGEGDDGIDGDEGHDKLLGEAGNDKLFGQAGDDQLWGGDGDDVLQGQDGNDQMEGGAGKDVAIGGNGDDTAWGGEGDDGLVGDNGNDTLIGQAGDDLLIGGEGHDKLSGGEGKDQLEGGAGNDQLDGGVDNDKLMGQVGDDILFGGDGDDIILGFTASNEAKQSLNAGETDNDALFGGAGNDVLSGGLGDDQLMGDTGDDTLLAGEDQDHLWGGDGNDLLAGEAGHDILMGESGNDRLFGDAGNDILMGGEGDDVLVGFTASDNPKQSLSAGESDDDALSGGAGNDNLYGGIGNDQLMGDEGDDLLLGEDGQDMLWGGAGKDELQGGAGNDQLNGGADDDRLFGQVGNDTLWGGDGNDLLLGFTAGNEAKRTLNPGETDDDILYGGAGSDALLGGLGQDQLYGGTERDELQGGAGDDLLFGEEGNDNLFGQVGNDILYGGDGDDYLQGFTAKNEEKQTLEIDESDNDFLYGGAGKDILVGGFGHDYLDGGAGADTMIGGQGDDIYIVNSVNDQIYEKADAGYDTVITSSNYLLNANIEELRLLEGYNIHGTGNALNNKIIGNSADNILDGITGADTLIGGAGNDTYYVDNAGDIVVECANEGIDSVQSSISYTLGAHVENLVLLDFATPEKGLVDGKAVLVYGYPKRNELDYMQGDEVKNYEGTCALTSIANLLTQAGRPTRESQVVNLAINNNWAVNDPSLPSHQRGGANINDQRAILTNYGFRNGVMMGYAEAGLANLLCSGRGVILGVNAGTLWDAKAHLGTGAVNHAVTLTGAVYDEADGSLLGFYLTDSGRGKVNDMTRFVDIAAFRQMANVPGAYAIYTIEPVKYWQENINGSGNELNNNIVGNRGNNTLLGMAGNDILVGGAGDDVLDGGTGDDVYCFNMGDGHDVINDSEGNDTLVMGAGIVARDVQIELNNARLKLSVGDGSVDMQAGVGQLIEQIKFDDGTVWHARADGSGYNARLSGQLNVEGTAQQGQVLNVVSTLSDADGLGQFTYLWERSADGVNWSTVADANTATLNLSEELVGQRVRASVSFIDGRGNQENATSHATDAITNINVSALSNQADVLTSVMASFSNEVAGQSSLAAHYPTTLTPVITTSVF